MSVNLASLPAPEAIEPLDDASIVAAMKADLGMRFPAIEPYLGLASEPAVKLLEAAAYREMILRARINDALKSRLVAFANGGDLDHLAAFYNVARLTGETDDAYRERLFIEAKAQSPGGGKYWYEAAARRADVRVKSALVWRETLTPVLHIAILSTENGGAASEDLLDAVRAEVLSDKVRLLNDTVLIEAAVTETTPVALNVWLLPEALASTIDAIAPAILAAWAGEAGIGFDLEPSWLRARAHLAGVKRVEVITPAATIEVSDGTALAIGPVTVNFMGYAF